MPRESEYTDEQADAICTWIAEGNSLSSWARKNKRDLSTIYKWLRQNESFAKNYARAREDAADSLVDRLMEIAETESDSQKAKLKCDNIKWVAARMKPKNYGDRHHLEHTGANGKDLTPPVIHIVRDDSQAN